jgi:hypothetical protein
MSEYLSNDSYHPFEIDGIVYPTVTHYVKMKSRGISDTVPVSLFQLRMISNKNKKQTNANKKYLLEQGTLQKFKQNPELLERLDATGNSVISYQDSDLGEILMKIRDDYRKSNRYKDVLSSELSMEEYNIIKEILKLSRKIQQDEKQSKLFDGMIEDAIYNILDDYYQDSFMNEIGSINLYYSNLPNFRELIFNIEKEINYKGRIPMTIGLFIKFYRENTPTLKSNIYTINYPAKKREYRKSFKL